MEENKMGTIPVSRLVISMALPLMLSLLINSLYNFVDSVFVARVSEDALTAISLAAPCIIARSWKCGRPERRHFPGTWRKESEKGKRCSERRAFSCILLVDFKQYFMYRICPDLF